MSVILCYSAAKMLACEPAVGFLRDSSGEFHQLEHIYMSVILCYSAATVCATEPAVGFLRDSSGDFHQLEHMQSTIRANTFTDTSLERDEIPT